MFLNNWLVLVLEMGCIVVSENCFMPVRCSCVGRECVTGKEVYGK